MLFPETWTSICAISLVATPITLKSFGAVLLLELLKDDGALLAVAAS
jgi:hypothetical protein